MHNSIKRSLAALALGTAVVIGTSGCSEIGSIVQSIEESAERNSTVDYATVADSSTVEEALKTPVTKETKDKSSESLKKLDKLKVIAKEGKMTGYKRDLFPHWESVSSLMKSPGSSDDWKRIAKDVPSNCTAREAILIYQSVTEPTYNDSCTIKSGSWINNYGKWDGEKVTGLGEVMTNAKTEVQIDHVIALGGSWRLGTGEWTTEKRTRFANDPLNLLAENGPANMSKGDKLVDQWVPYNPEAACKYMTAYVNISTKYAMPVTTNIKDSLTKDLTRCVDEVSPQFMNLS